MNIQRPQALILATAGCAILFCSETTAQDTPQEVRFAAPQRIRAGDAFLGEGRLYPSPVLHDVDGDKHLDIVIGDLPGRVTVAHRAPGEPGVRFGAEKPLKDRNGEQLAFENW